MEKCLRNDIQKFYSKKLICSKVDASTLITTMIRTPIFKCYVVRFVSRNWHRKGTCFKDGLMSFESDEINGYGHDLESLIILH